MALQTGIIFLLKDRFQFFSPNTRSILEFRFPPEAIRDLDVLDQDLLDNLIKAFVVNTKIAPCKIIVILSASVSIVRDIIPQHAVTNPEVKVNPKPVAIKPEEMTEQISLFLEHVPYDKVVSISFSVPGGKRVYATNKELFDAVINSFEKLGFSTDNVLPGILLGNLSSRPVMDASMVNFVLSKADTFKQYNLIGISPFQPKTQQLTDEESSTEKDLLDEKVISQKGSKTDKKRLLLLVGVFVLLLIILAVVYYESTISNSPPSKNSTSDAQTQVVLATTIQPTSMLTITVPMMQSLSVQITNTLPTTQSASLLKGALQVYGFKFINEDEQPHLKLSKTLIVFSQNVYPEVRNLVINEVKKTNPNLSVENGKAPYDILITLAE